MVESICLKILFWYRIEVIIIHSLKVILPVVVVPTIMVSLLASTCKDNKDVEFNKQKVHTVITRCDVPDKTKYTLELEQVLADAKLTATVREQEEKEYHENLKRFYDKYEISVPIGDTSNISNLGTAENIINSTSINKEKVYTFNYNEATDKFKKQEYYPLVVKYCNMYKLPKSFQVLVAALIKQESGGNQFSDNGYAVGYMQIECTHEDSFRKFGYDVSGEYWDLNDRYDADKNIHYGVHVISDLYRHYDGDIAKILQGYNYGCGSLDKLIEAFGDDWIAHRSEVAYYNGEYDRTGSTSYGDPKYIEHVLSRIN